MELPARAMTERRPDKTHDPVPETAAPLSNATGSSTSVSTDRPPEPEHDDDGVRPAASLAQLRIRPSQIRRLRHGQRKSGDISVAAEKAAAAQDRPLATFVAKPLQNVTPPTVAARKTEGTAPAATDAKAATAAAPSSAEPAAQNAEPRSRNPVRQRALTNARREPADIHGYWNRLRFGRPYPAWSDLDRDQVAYFWPSSILLMVEARPGGSKGPPVIRKAMRVSEAEGQAAPQSRIPFSDAVVTWLLAVGRDVAATGEPIREAETFLANGVRDTYQVVALPLAEDDSPIVDRVLCQIDRA